MTEETVVGLVSRYSPSGQEGEAAAWLVERMRALGYGQAFVDGAGNAVGVFGSGTLGSGTLGSGTLGSGTLGSGARQVVLLGHIDTVPGEIAVRVEDGLLHGRGAVDAKGPLAAFTDAAARVGAVEGWQIVVIGAVDEERSSAGARFAAGQYRPEFAIIGEPNRWDRVALGYKGSAGAAVTVRREQAHPASGSQTASEAAVAAWLAIKARAEQFNAQKQRAFDQVLVGLRGMESGQDGFEQWARLSVGARLPLDVSPREWYGWLGEIEGCEVVPQGDAVPAWAVEKNSALVRAFLKAIRAQGGTPSFVYKTGTADLNIVAPVWQCPALVYGPGDSALDHTPHEHLSLAEYAKSVDVLVDMLRELVKR